MSCIAHCRVPLVVPPTSHQRLKPALTLEDYLSTWDADLMWIDAKAGFRCRWVNAICRRRQKIDGQAARRVTLGLHAIVRGSGRRAARRLSGLAHYSRPRSRACSARAQPEAVGKAKPPGSNQHRVKTKPDAPPTLAEAGISTTVKSHRTPQKTTPKPSEAQEWP